MKSFPGQSMMECDMYSPPILSLLRKEEAYVIMYQQVPPPCEAGRGNIRGWVRVIKVIYAYPSLH
jgi:hypothetical protein